jgi:hypothetical protein
MVPLSVLPAVAVLFASAGVVWPGCAGLEKRGVIRDGAAAVKAAAASVVPGIRCYAIGTQFADETVYRNAGSACLAAFPAFSAVVLTIAAPGIMHLPDFSPPAFGLLDPPGAGTRNPCFCAKAMSGVRLRNAIQT